MDDSTLSGRLKRYTQVSSAVTGLAARLAGEKYLGVTIDRDKHASDLMAVLGGLKGPLMKVAQFLATVPGALPPEYAQELLKLQSQAPSMGWNFVRRRMNHELGPSWQELFQTFSHEASAAASLGQVHQAMTKEGIPVACKLQYPDMESAIEADLTQLNLFLKIYEAWNSALQTSDIQKEIKDRLHEELDYQLEADHIHLYQNIFASHPQTIIPTVLPHLSTKRLLTMTWMEGESILSLLDGPAEERNDIAQRLFHTWYYPLYHYGVIHGDPHPGNYKVHKPTSSLQLLDFGCVRVFPPSFVWGVIELYHALLHNNPDQAVHAYEIWGFKNLTKAVIDIIGQWAKLIYAPLLEDRVRPIQDDLEGLAGWETATKVHEELNKAGGIRPPREFVFMDRAAVGIGSVIMRLRAEHNWYRLFNELIENFSVTEMERRQDQLRQRERPLPHEREKGTP
jgi:predicted unusual protein kinase regulating ubiquinone biosynthesis (AarF/ABC1/UbiB family)